MAGFLLSLWLMLVRKQVVPGAGLLVGATAVALLRNLGRDVTTLTTSDQVTMLIEVLALAGALLILAQSLRQSRDQKNKRAVD